MDRAHEEALVTVVGTVQELLNKAGARQRQSGIAGCTWNVKHRPESRLKEDDQQLHTANLKMHKEPIHGSMSHGLVSLVLNGMIGYLRSHATAVSGSDGTDALVEPRLCSAPSSPAGPLGP